MSAAADAPRARDAAPVLEAPVLEAPVLEARGVEKRFGAVAAADAVSLSVAEGERLSLIGANGAGKTTFMNLVTGYLKPDAGAILLDGQDITRLGPRRIAQQGVCRSFQIPQLLEPMSAKENLMVALGASGRRFARLSPAQEGAEAEALAVLGRFEIEAQADRRVSELPGGVRKLLDIAMAIVRAPRVLLLDEPTSGVSMDEKFPLMDTVMAAIADRAVTVVFVEHDMEIVTRYSERVIAFYQGRVIADGPPATALSDPQVRRYVTGEPAGARGA